MKPDIRNCGTAYVFLTATHNKEAHIVKTIESVLSQTLLPKRWVIVSDSSFDRTDEIAQARAGKHDFVRFLRVTRSPRPKFSLKGNPAANRQ